MEQNRRRFQPPAPELMGLAGSARLDELLAGCEAICHQALPPAGNGESHLLLHDAQGSGGWLCITRRTLLKGRQHRPYTLRCNLLELARRTQRWRVAEAAPRDWIDLPRGSDPGPIGDRSPLSIVIPLREEHRLIGVWLIGIATSVENLSEASEQLLLPAASQVGGAVGRVLELDLLLSERQQAQQAAQALLRAATLDDQAALLGTLVNLLGRIFGLTRVAVMLLHADSQTLRGVLHTGFESTFRLPTLALDDEHSFTQGLRRGAIRFFARGEDTLPSDVPLARRGARGVLIPLRHQEQPLGVIYADQTEHSGLPLPAAVCELIGALTSAALENIRLRSVAEARAETDALTGLLNRAYLDKLLRIEIPRVKRYNQPISLLMVDLDNFKQSNDAYGHQFGDFLLRETARLIQANVRRPDVVVRYGGDEFVVLMFNTAYEQAVPVRDRIEAAFAERNRLHRDPKMMITISLGLRSADAESIDSLIYEADMEMYAQKARQRRRQLIAALLGESLEAIEAADKVVGSLSKMLRNKLPGAAGHARRVTQIAVLIGLELGLPEADLETLALAALLHDLGMASLPAALLTKREGLTANEREALRQHVLLGEEFFQGIEHLEPVRPLIRQHHERWDGRIEGEDGAFPHGLQGKQIVLGARILALAERWEGLAAPRAGERLEQIQAESGAALDPEVVKALLARAGELEHLGDLPTLRGLLKPLLHGVPTE